MHGTFIVRLRFFFSSLWSFYLTVYHIRAFKYKNMVLDHAACVSSKIRGHLTPSRQRSDHLASSELLEFPLGVCFYIGNFNYTARSCQNFCSDLSIIFYLHQALCPAPTVQRFMPFLLYTAPHFCFFSQTNGFRTLCILELLQYDRDFPLGFLQIDHSPLRVDHAQICKV